LHLVALRILEDLDLIKSDVKGAISANNKATRVRPDMDPLGNPMDMGYPTDWAK